MIWAEFAVCAALLVLASTVLSRYTDVLAEKTGWGRAWVGAILLAGVTSLPELASGLSAVVWLNAPNLAAGAILGSCLFNLALIAVMDLAYQPGSILAKAQEGHVLSAALGILLLALVAAGVFVGATLNGTGLLGISVLSVAVVVLYALGARLISRFEQHRLAQVLQKEAEVYQYAAISTLRTYMTFTLSAVVVVALGIWLATLGDRISATTGLSRTFVGSLFLAISTSLPEIASSLTAVRIGAIDLAISNALSSNLFNIMLLAVYDIADGSGSFWNTLSDANGLTAVAAVMMTGVVIVSLVYRASPRTPYPPYRVSWDAVVLVVMYLGTMALLYGMGR